MTTKPPVPAHATFIVVPAGTPASTCRGPSCQKRIYFARNPRTGSPTPVDCNVEGGETPSETKDASQLDMLAGAAGVHDGRGISHFFTCVDAEMFSRHKGAR
jgi:hypothetical protein